MHIRYASYFWAQHTLEDSEDLEELLCKTLFHSSSKKILPVAAQE